MSANHLNELDKALEELNWRIGLEGLDQSRVLGYIHATIEDEEVLAFHVNEGGGNYSGLSFALQVLVRTSTLMFEFLFAANLERYDVVYLSDVNRIEEQVETENSVEGRPRRKVTLTIDFRPGAATQISQYAERGEDLAAFGESLRKSVFSRSS